MIDPSWSTAEALAIGSWEIVYERAGCAGRGCIRDTLADPLNSLKSKQNC